MKLKFIGALSVFALLCGEYANARNNDELIKYSNKESYKKDMQQDVHNALTRTEFFDPKALSKNIETQSKEVKVLRTALQHQSEALNNLNTVKEMQSKAIQTLKSLISDKRRSSELDKVLRMLRTAHDKQSNAIKNLQTVQVKQQDAVKNLVATHKTQFGWLVISESTRNLIMFTAIKKGYTNIVDALLRAGADPNAVDTQGITPAMIAAQYDETILAMLIKAGANIRAKDKKGYSVLDYAYIGDLKKNIQLLSSKGAKRSKTTGTQSYRSIR